MARAIAAEAIRTIEAGAVTFLYRPRVELPFAADLDDVQRILVLLSPENATFERLIAIGRKRLPSSAQHERFWGFVDLVLTPYDMNAALGAQVYGTKTKGLRHVAAAQSFASGHYELVSHASHSHLRWRVESYDRTDAVGAAIELEREADYIVTVANPDPTVWGLLETPDLQAQLFDELELHVTIPTPFPPPLQSRFGNHRFAQVDSTEWLDHPGAELVFVGSGD